MNAEVYDILFRSRKTLLSILESKGYNIEPYEKFGPEEISAMIISEKKNALRMDLTRTKDDPIKQCVVLYRLNRLKQSIAKFMTGLSDPEDENYIKEPSSTEVYVILLEPVNTNNQSSESIESKDKIIHNDNTSIDLKNLIKQEFLQTN